MFMQIKKFLIYSLYTESVIKYLKFRRIEAVFVLLVSEDLGISRSSVHRILNHKFSLVQELHPQDPNDRVNFCKILCLRSQGDENFWKKIIWTDVCKFSREGQTCLLPYDEG